MKRIIALMLALIFVLSLVACQSEEDLQKERSAVNGMLQGNWTSMTNSDSKYQFYYGLVFKNGKYEFASINAGATDLSYSEEGTYEVYPKSKEIICTVTSGNEYIEGKQKTFTYEYNSSTLQLYDGQGNKFTKSK